MTTCDHRRELVLSPQEIQDRVREVALEIHRDLSDSSPLFIGVLKGCFIFISDLVRAMPSQAEVDFLRVASYGGSQSSGEITLLKEPEVQLTGRTVVLVEDIVDTGLTLNWLVGYMKGKGAAQVKVCALIDKPERRENEVQVDYVCFKIPKGFLVGYGMDYNEMYRCLPGVWELLF